MNLSYQHVLNRICEEVQQEMANKWKENEIEWTVKAELLFLYAMIGHKPVGVNRHFMMLLIHNKFTSFLNHQISSKVLWDHLDTMYDMAALHESEIIPFPNDEVDFELPEDCHELLRIKHGVTLKKSSSESDTDINNTNLKIPKKLAPKIKATSTPISTPKSNFASPVPSKPGKIQTVAKSESKTLNSDLTPKSKQESGISPKMNKIRRSSSPITVKSESASHLKEESPDVLSNKKYNKLERGNSPATLKNPTKVDPVITKNSIKKPSKSESSANSSKSVKTETSDSNVKKIKVDKDVFSKKSKIVTPSDIAAKILKVDMNGIKKRTVENTPKKSSESSSTKQIKTEVKTSSQLNKGQDMETPHSTGPRKASTVVKVKTSENSKKLKLSRAEEAPKKLTPTPKRRRQ